MHAYAKDNPEQILNECSRDVRQIKSAITMQDRQETVSGLMISVHSDSVPGS